jgi:hypothetical protein
MLGVIPKNEAEDSEDVRREVTKESAQIVSSLSLLEQQSSTHNLENKEINQVLESIRDEDFHFMPLSPSESQSLTSFSEEVNQLRQLVMHQNRQIEFLSKELHITKTILSALSANVVIHDKDTQYLIASTNNLMERIQSHHGHESLTMLFDCLVKDLRKYCEELIPMASGMYLPHHSNKLKIEIAHESAHMAEHLVHEASHALMHYLPSLQKVIKITGGIMHQVPLLSFALAAFDIISAHRHIHQAEHTAGKLRIFSADQRNILYHYVMASTLLLLATRIYTNTPINHPVAKNHPLSENRLMQWYALLLAESVSSLTGLHDIHDDIHGINGLAIHWSESIIHKFLQPGVDVLDLIENNQIRVYSQKELEVALKIQRIFTEPMSNSSHHYLARSIKDSFLDVFHHELYHNVLKPYRRCANRWPISAFLTGYLSVLETLQKWQSRFIHALTVVNEELRPLKEQSSRNFELQLCLINTCLFGNLQSMCSDMRWHKAANGLFLNMSNQSLDCIREPLKLTDNNEIELVTGRALIVLANARAARAENENDKIKEELIKANARADEYKARAAEAEALVRKNEKTIALLKEVQMTSKQSSLVENSLFKPSSGGNIIESKKAEFSCNATLQ